MKRVIVIGTTGAGKTTFAKRLAKKQGLVYIELDDLHWLPDWQERPTEEFRSLIAKAVQAEKWAVAGNYATRTQDITWPLADTLVWLDMPFLPNFWYLVRRTFARSLTDETICNGNKETLYKQFFTSGSILWWFLKTWHKNRQRFGVIFANPQLYPQFRLVRLRSYRESRAFIEELGNSPSPGGGRD